METAIKRIAQAKETKARRLDLSGLKLTELPEQILELAAHLEELDLSWNSIGEKWAEHISTLRGLTTLDLSGSSIGDKGAEHISTLTSLTSLDLWGNGLGEKGAEYVSKLAALTTLNLMTNSIGDRGAQYISRLKRLTDLNLWENSIGDKGAEYISSLINLSVLRLSENFIGDEGAMHISKLDKLTVLNMSSNAIMENGVEYFSKLSNLTMLHLSNNTIGDRGAWHVSKLSKLTKLSLANAFIQDSAAEHISKLNKLVKLDLSNNTIGEKGAEYISKLKSLADLDLSRNEIGDSGAGHVSMLQKLTVLDLSHNVIGDRGAEHISKLSDISELYLRKNQIRDGGAEHLARLQNLKHLSLVDNPIERIPQELLRDAKGFLAYFGARERKPNDTIRMVLMGNGCSGKSVLGKLLSTGEYEREWHSTHGIQHWKWEVAVTESTFMVNVFDFGGQDYYHATHNLFINRSRENAVDSLYLVLWHTDKESKESGQDHSLAYWLGNVRHYSAKAPIWCVQNKLDLTRREWIDTALARTYDVGQQYHICLKVNDPKGGKTLPDAELHREEFERFRTHLSRTLRAQTVVQRLPVSWFPIRDEHLPSWRQQHLSITIDAFRKLCLSTVGKDAYDKEEALAFPALLPYLHSVGEILVFDDVPGLNDRVFLDPIALTKAIYDELLPKDVLEERRGEFTLPKKDDVTRKRLEEYLQLLLAKELVFEKPLNPGVYVAPQYLPEDAHSFHFASLIPASFVLRFNGYFPRHRITQFITRYASKSENPLYWKFGAFFKKDGVHAMVRIESAKSTLVHVHVGSEKGRYGLMRELFHFFLGVERNPSELVGIHDIRGETALDKRAMRRARIRSISIRIVEDELPRDERILKDQPSLAELSKFVDLSTNGKDFAPLKDWKQVIDSKGSHVESDGKRLRPDAVVHQLLGDDRSATPKRIFLSYSHKDEGYKEELDAHFSALKRSGKVETWNDRRIEAGELWDSKILDTLGESDIFIALLSPDFMASDYIWKKEVPLAKAKGCVIVPVFLRACDFAETPFDPSQGFPRDEQSEKSISKKKHTQWIVGNPDRHRDISFLEVVEGIKGILNK